MGWSASELIGKRLGKVKEGIEELIGLDKKMMIKAPKGEAALSSIKVNKMQLQSKIQATHVH